MQIVSFTPNGHALFEAPPLRELSLEPVTDPFRRRSRYSTVRRKGSMNEKEQPWGTLLSTDIVPP